MNLQKALQVKVNKIKLIYAFAFLKICEKEKLFLMTLDSFWSATHSHKKRKI